ncbi:hypothetical protein ACP3TY_06105 [Pseudomonas rustica]|uniref:hypothetical protein n=1 Tax=Pseudomonas TaxID=286 RepID=UPI00087B39EF|nr:hypothetical protein [Pseudomonas sp. Z003-0.4C(8344-21)]SDS63363.1 hypothetical protein SAMN05216496_2036 [Pseudomonas sp. Z003-0.4C(8344-21)]
MSLMRITLPKQPGFDPQLRGLGYKTAKEYSRKLAIVGSGLFVGCGALFFVPLTQPMALGLAGVLLGLACIVGRKYNKHACEFVKHTSLPQLIKIFAPTWRYMLMTTILLGVGLGLNEWSVYAEKKEMLLSLILSAGCFDSLKSFLTTK